jgi:hypothetical protein
MKTYTFNSDGKTYIVEAENLTAALAEFRRQLRATK